MIKLLFIFLMISASVCYGSNFFARIFFPKSFFSEINGTALFNSHSWQNGVELSVINENGKLFSHDLYPGINSSSPREFFVVGNTVYFAANSQVGFELWSYVDGVGPKIFKDIFPGRKGSFPAYFTRCMGRLFFTADLPNRGRELAVLDLSSGEFTFFDHEPGLTSAYPIKLTCFKNKLFYVIKDVPKNKGIYSLDGNLRETLEYQTTGFETPNLLNLNNETLIFEIKGAYRKYEAPGKVEDRDFLDIKGVPQDIIARSVLWRLPERRICGEIDDSHYGKAWTIVDIFKNIPSSSNISEMKEERICEEAKYHRFSYLFHDKEKLYIQKGYVIAALNVQTGLITPVMNSSNLKLKEFYSVIKLGEINFTKARRITDGEIIEVYFKDGEVIEYKGPGSMYDLIFFNGSYYYRDSMLSSRLRKILL
ncbi:hypothetical protein ACES2L_07175 [Bdellovibrio bacteriovorus]